MDAVKVRSYTMSKNGARGAKISLPPEWVQDMGLVAGSKIDIYRDSQDRLIIIALKGGLK